MELNILVNYKGYFLSKINSIPYGSGMNKEKLEKEFKRYGIKTIFLQITDVDFREMNFKDKLFLYPSSEDKGYFYKSYIEDIILGLYLQGAILIPEYKHLRANNNKVFMEILRDIYNVPEILKLRTVHIGTYEDILRKKELLKDWPGYVIKKSTGSSSKEVYLAKSFDELLRKVKKIGRTTNLLYKIRDILRSYYRKGYKPDSKYRNKLIIQEFIPNLENDWKVLVFWDKIYVLKRETRKNDFRASGSGNFSFDKQIPPNILDYSLKIRKIMNLPCVSLDICYDGSELYLVEFQALQFGTYTLVESKFFYQKIDGMWKIIETESIIEEEYAYCIYQFLRKKGLLH